MKAIVVGGNFGDAPKPSSISAKMAQGLHANLINGGSFQDLQNVSLCGYDLIIWMPNIENGYPKVYPQKDIGSILICTKRMREQTTITDAVTRIFNMHGNAVIAIDGDQTFSFALLDALCNVWVNTSDIPAVMAAVIKLVEWTKASKRSRSVESTVCLGVPNDNIGQFAQLNQQLAEKFIVECGRYFGNASTRCMKMFPSTRVMVSRRNVNKRFIEASDFVYAHLQDDLVVYEGPHKPSVDTPSQLSIYHANPRVNYMIHGHAYVEGAPFTTSYFPCGDLREVPEVLALMQDHGVINLKNHGFLMYANSLDQLEVIVDKARFTTRPMPENL